MKNEIKRTWYNPIAGMSSRVFEYEYHDTEEDCLASIERVKKAVNEFLDSIEPKRVTLTKCKYCDMSFRNVCHLKQHERVCKNRPQETDHD